MGNIANHSKQNMLHNKAWLNALKELCIAGLPLSSIPRELEQRGLQPVDMRTVNKYIQSGLVPGVTPELYAEARLERENLKKRLHIPTTMPKIWLTAVSRMMTDGCPVEMISKELIRRGIKPSSTYVITQKLRNGEILGHTKES